MTELTTASVATVGGSAARRIPGLAALTHGAVVVGPASTCRCAPRDNLALHRLVARAPAGSVLVCGAGGETERGHFGDLMALDARSRGLAGLVIDGAVRDATAVAASGFPVFHLGLAPVPCAKERALSVGEPVEVARVLVTPGDVVVADADAVLVVARADWPAVEAAALELEAREKGLREALARGERLGDLLGLDLGAEE